MSSKGRNGFSRVSDTSKVAVMKVHTFFGIKLKQDPMRSEVSDDEITSNVEMERLNIWR